MWFRTTHIPPPQAYFGVKVWIFKGEVVEDRRGKTQALVEEIRLGTHFDGFIALRREIGVGRGRCL